MHEGNFTQQIVDTIIAELNNYPGYRPKRIKVKVGEMLHLEQDSVKLHFDLLTRGTLMADARLEMQGVPVKVRCRQCGNENSAPDHHMLYCERCSSTKVDILSGNNIVIEAVEMELWKDSAVKTA